MGAYCVRCSLLLAVVTAVVSSGRVHAQQSATSRTVEYRHALPPTGFFRVWNPNGAVRVGTWDRDSVVVTGSLTPGAEIHCGAGGAGAKCFVSSGLSSDTASAPADLDVRVPRLASVWVKSAAAEITVSARGGSIEAYSVTGVIHVTGPARAVQVESMGGAIDIDVAALTVRARSGEGALLLGGSIEDADVSSVTGAVRVRGHIRQGRVESIDGPIEWTAPPAPGGRVDLVSHGGRIDVHLPGGAGGRFDISSYKGGVVCHGSGVRQRAAGPGREVTCSIPPARDARFTIRNFKGQVLIARD